MGEVINAAIYRADLEGVSDRHTTLDLTREANLSYRDLRVKLANSDMQTVLQPTAILSLPVIEAVTGGGYAEIDWPTNAVSVHGLDVKVGGYWSNVQQGTFAQRRLGPLGNDRGDYGFSDEGLTMWVQRSLPTTSGSTQVAGKIMLFPVPTGGQYVLWFLPEWVDILNGTDLFPGQESWLQWVIWDLACKALIRDVGPQGSKQLDECVAARERSWIAIKANTTRLAQDGPIQVSSRYGGMRSGHRMVP
jgi:hypothetical protein